MYLNQYVECFGMLYPEYLSEPDYDDEIEFDNQLNPESEEIPEDAYTADKREVGFDQVDWVEF